MKDKKTRVIVSGAGPGGVIAAYVLAEKGVLVELHDKALFPRDKICGDALSGKVVEVLKQVAPHCLDELRAFEKQIGSYGVHFFAPNKNSLRIPFKKAFSMQDPAPGFISKRLDFDNFLVEKLLKHPNIEFIQNSEITNYNRVENQLEVCFSNGNKQLADYVIGADGAHSKLAKFHGFKQVPKYYCAGIRAYYKGVEGMDIENFIELHFLKDVLPGYFWIFPLPNGMANIGLGMRSDKISEKKINLKHLLNEIIENAPTIKDRFQNAELEGSVKGFGLPLGSVKRKLSGDNYLLIGDAASLIDPFTGEGIGNAMFSGKLAAETICEAIAQNKTNADFLSKYDTLVYDRLWSELKLSYTMQRLVKFPWLFNYVVNKASRNETLRDTISCMFEDIDLRQEFKKPSFYWKLLWN
ncbi:MAG: geranylgeranyl reductase family protein [Chitinophagaceae bacterium]|nr:MAG: geranylgeranyl reductase family protein [Chitinophagaceae bacterium]